MNRLIKPISIVCLIACLSPIPAMAQAGAAGKAVTELVEYFTKAGTKSAAKELVEIGGEKAVRETFEKAAREGGEELVQQVVGIARKNGPRALKALEADPALMSKSLRVVPEDKITSVIAETARQPELMAKLVRTHGDDVLITSARHPGVGTKVIDEFGEAGLVAAKKLETGDVIVLARTKGFNDLPSPTKEKFLRLLRDDPKKVTDSLLRLAAGGTAIVLSADIVNRIGDQIVGTADAPGRLIQPIITTSWIFGGIIAAALAIYLGIKLMGVAQRTKRKTNR